MTAGILLCAGGGRRFDGDGHKLVVPYRGRPLVQWALESIGASGFDEVIVVVGALDLTGLTPPGVTVVVNADWATGQASSVQAGVARAEEQGHQRVVIGLGDQPLVPPGAWRSVGDSPAAIAVAVFAGHRSPPVGLDHVVWPLLPTTGDVGARTLIGARPDLVVEVPCIGDPADVDTTADLAALPPT